MSHDPMCPNGEMTWLPETAICLRCVVIARVREDERTYAKQTSTAIMAYDEGRKDGYATALRDAVEAVTVYADETHKHYGDLFGHCRQEYGDRCDITAALRVAVQKIEGLGPERTTVEHQ